MNVNVIHLNRGIYDLWWPIGMSTIFQITLNCVIQDSQFLQFEITFSASTRCLYVFILPAGRHPILFQCANMYAGSGHSNTKYNTKYYLFWP